MDAGVDPLLARRADRGVFLRHLDAEGLHQEEAHRPSVAQRGGHLVGERRLVVGDVGDLLEGVPCGLVLAAVRRAVREEQLVVEVVRPAERERDRVVGLLRHTHRPRGVRARGDPCRKRQRGGGLYRRFKHRHRTSFLENGCSMCTRHSLKRCNHTISRPPSASRK